MISETGHFALILALAVAALQGTLPLVGAWRGDAGLVGTARPAAIVQFMLVALAFGCLMVAYIASDFSVINVANNSHSAKPLLYKISGVWGNHEGSLLLWILILTFFGAAVAVFGRNLPDAFRARVLAVQALIGIGFLLFILFTSNPFLRVFPPPMDGGGLNPLLQDPGLAFHPPLLYLGYVGFSTAFSFAIAALIEGRVDPVWGRWVRPWVLGAWCALTGGIALGSWWAYYELGWGGWWFWDPVENASFMPWLAGTALLHSVIVVEKRDALKTWTVLLAILTFSLSLLGTFLVRSGVLTSVHAFATDPARGVFILAFLVAVVGGSLALFAVRAPSLKGGGVFAPISREGFLVLNNLLLAAAVGTVFLGTLYPLFLDAIAGEKVSVGPPYFERTFVPLMVPLVLLMAVGPLLKWKRSDLAGIAGRLKAAALGAAMAVLAAVYWVDAYSALAFAGIALAGWLLVGAAAIVVERAKFRPGQVGQSFVRLARTPWATWGTTVAHLGMAIMILGVTASETWQVEKLLVMRPGESVQVGAYRFTFEGTVSENGANYASERGTFQVSRDGKPFVILEPEQRRYPVPPMTTTEAAIHPMISGDLYAVVGDPNGDGGWSTRIYFKPLVSWIWGGALIMMLGGMLSLIDRRHRVGAPARVRARKTRVAEGAT